MITDPGLVEGHKETIGLVFENIIYVTNSDPSYPASLCAAIVVGTVVGAKGFVSEDRTYVYSDYTVRVDQILKPDPAAKLIIGGQLIASRAGATVHFPSGHTKRYFVTERGLPETGKQYLLFLVRPDPDLPEYELLYRTPYELSNGRAYPLDDDHYYSENAEWDATLLIAKVKKAIAAAPK